MKPQPAPFPDGVSGARLAAALGTLPVIGIIRGCPPENLLEVAERAVAGGIVALEVTLDSPEPLRGIEAIAGAGLGAVVGAGTVHGAQAVRSVAAAGAGFVVSPHTDEATLAACQEAALPALPGAATPSEIARAQTLGAFAVKVFPAAQLGGPAFIAAVMAPLRNPALVPTGGVDASNARGYLEAGALAVGVGGSVFGRDAMLSGDGEAIERAVGRLKEALL